jgi:hypothetical protein
MQQIERRERGGRLLTSSDCGTYRIGGSRNIPQAARPVAVPQRSVQRFLIFFFFFLCLYLYLPACLPALLLFVYI